MQISITLAGAAALFAAMTALAFLPSISVLTVATRSASYGFVHGLATSLGIVAGDIVFILIAILGLSLLADSMGPLFVLIKYLGGAYLIWLGIKLWRAKPGRIKAESRTESSLLSSFITGLVVTLADQKAILFYLGFFPAFFNLSAMTPSDILIVILITLVAVGGAKLVYAYLADKAGVLLEAKINRAINGIAGTAMLATGAYLIFFSQ